MVGTSIIILVLALVDEEIMRWISYKFKLKPDPFSKRKRLEKVVGPIWLRGKWATAQLCGDR